MAAPAPAAAAGGIVPAQLGFLAIFNPSLGSTDETVDDQIVYYASVTTQSSRKRRRAKARPTDNISQEERNERLRQIGLAQGMVNFSRGFSDGAPMDAIDTEKSRVIAHELEPGWWILASIDLNKVPLPPRLPTKPGEKPEERYEYTSREMKPAALVLRDLLRAHNIFLLHHDSSLSSLFVRTRRSKFVAILSRYWDLFLSTWNVMLHGNPIRDVFGGINVAASGELGVGVGEEERGSGEREVLEGLVGRIEGLVDLVVSRFGDDDADSNPKKPSKGEPEPWLGSGKEPAAEDGAIFLGAGGLSKKSLRDVTHWMEDLYTWGEHAYGVIESPTSIRRTRHRKTPKAIDQDGKQKSKGDLPTGAAQSAESNNPDSTQNPQPNDVDQAEAGKDADSGKLDKMVSYLTLGYGSYWSFPLTGTSTPEPTNSEADQDKSTEARPHLPGRTSSYDASGHYLIGLKGAIEDEVASDPDSAPGSPDPDSENNSRTVLRTVHVELETGGHDRPEGAVIKDFGHPGSPFTQSQVVGNQRAGYDSHDVNKAEKLRVVVYVNKPFIFTFLFRLRTDSLAWDALYRSLHYQLAPLRKPLLASTKYRPERPDAGPVTSSIHDLVWDPSSLTVHSTIPNIPDYVPESYQRWSRADAVSTHIHLLNLQSTTRSRITDLEPTRRLTPKSLSVIRESARSSTSSLDSQRSRQSSSSDPKGGSASSPTVVGKEIYLIRRASDHIGYRMAADETAGGGGDGAGRLAQGIGVDTRRYVEELLSLF
ncbi:Vacuolar fusionCCZ1-like-like protein [Cladobotryum mycophilum]|uniref:Vacuolar fusionCCZ1-like-like protein n=1 Tax=Cladobotryum mycophilum TaxID=491253 RepID=A0ABR0SJM3_9HYPO